MKTSPFSKKEYRIETMTASQAQKYIDSVRESGRTGIGITLSVKEQAELAEEKLKLAPSAKEDGIPEEPTLCVICNKTWEDHFTLGRQKVCYNQDPSRMAIIQGTTFTAPPEPKVASLQEPEGDLPPLLVTAEDIELHGYTGKPLIKQDHTTKYEGDWSPIHPCWKNDGLWFMNDREGRATHWRKTFAPPLPYQESAPEVEKGKEVK